MKKIMLIGGAARSLILFRGDLIRQFVELGYEVTAVSAPASERIKEEIISMAVEFFSIPLERDSINPYSDLKTTMRLKSLIKNVKPDTIIAYTAKPIGCSAVACIWANSACKLFFLVTGLGYAFSGNTIKQRFVRFFLLRLYKFAFDKAEKIIFQNEDDRKLFEKLKVFHPESKVYVINGSGVNTEYYYFTEPKQKGPLTFLLIGRMLQSKGINEYVQAARIIKSNYPGVDFMLLGPLSRGPDSIEEELIESWQTERIISYNGWEEDVRSYIKKCDVYVLPSYREGTPRSVLEAMSMGKPIITTDVPGCRDTVVNGVNGFLVRPRDSVALAEAMRKFIDNPELIVKMGKESRIIAEDIFDVNKVNRSIINIIGL